MTSSSPGQPSPREGSTAVHAEPRAGRRRRDHAHRDVTVMEVPSAWAEFIRYCREIGYGEIERLQIHDGLPVSAESVKKKVRFK